eukprot:1161841-Pelagomonas_calceolata.AAC.13
MKPSAYGICSLASRELLMPEIETYLLLRLCSCIDISHGTGDALTWSQQDQGTAETPFCGHGVVAPRSKRHEPVLASWSHAAPTSISSSFCRVIDFRGRILGCRQEQDGHRVCVSGICTNCMSQHSTKTTHLLCTALRSGCPFLRPPGQHGEAPQMDQPVVQNKQNKRWGVRSVEWAARRMRKVKPGKEDPPFQTLV